MNRPCCVLKAPTSRARASRTIRSRSVLFRRLEVFAFRVGFRRRGKLWGGGERDRLEELVESGALRFELGAIRSREHPIPVQLESERIDEDAVALDAEMQVSSGRTARRPDVADELTRFDGLASGEVRGEPGKVRVAGRD